MKLISAFDRGSTSRAPLSSNSLIIKLVEIQTIELFVEFTTTKRDITDN